MRSFFKFFFASLLALVVFCMIIFFFTLAVVGTLASKEKEEIASKTILELDLSQTFSESSSEEPFDIITGDGESPSLYELVRLIKHAKTDDKISGIFIRANGNGNGFASSNELRNALLDFRNSKKFVIAHADVMSQQAYFVACAAERVYINPVGMLSWEGFNITMPFVKGTLEKMDIETQIF